MKRNFFYVGALMLSALALTTACSNDDFAAEQPAVEGNYTLTATVGGDTRTYVDGTSVKWSTGDKILVYNASTSATLTLSTTSNEGKTGTFTGTVAGNPTFTNAVYPADKFTMESNAPSKYTFPADNGETCAYTYPESGSMASNSPMYGTVSGTNVSFSHLAGMVRITLEDVPTNSTATLELKGKGIAGEATFNSNALSMNDTNTEQTVTVDFGGKSGNLVFDIPVPAGTYSGGVGTVTLSISGKDKQLFTITNETVTAGKIINMPAIHDISVTATGLELTSEADDAKGIQALIDKGVTNIESTSISGTDNTIKLYDTGDVYTLNLSASSEASVTIEGTSKNSSAANVRSEYTANNGIVKKLILKGLDQNKIKVTLKNIHEVEIDGVWPEANIDEGCSNVTVKAESSVEKVSVTEGATVESIVVEESTTEGATTPTIEIAEGGSVSAMEQGGVSGEITIPTAATATITLNGNASISDLVYVPENTELTINVGAYKLTAADGTASRDLNGTSTTFNKWDIRGNLTIIGDENTRGTLENKCHGIYLSAGNASFTMKNINYSETNTSDSRGIVVGKYVSSTFIEVENCDMNCMYYCVNTNASEKVGTSNVITLTNSTFIAKETPLMCNIPATLTATNCTFTGGWQAAFVRAGTVSLTNCGLNLNVSSNYGGSNIAAGNTSWKDGNQAPSAALTIGNQNSSAYKYDKIVNLTNCTLSVQKDSQDSQEYPAVYIDSNGQAAVKLTYDEATGASINAAGTGLDIRSTTDITINDQPYTGKTDSEDEESAE